MFHPKKKFELSPKLKLGVGRAASKNQILTITGSVFLLLAIALTIHAFSLIRQAKQTHDTAVIPQILGATDARPQLKFEDYKVQKGDTVFNISQKFKVPWTILATLNKLRNPFALKIGQVLKIPKQ